MEFLGDLPTWITAIAVVFAFVQYRTDRDRRRDELDLKKREERREQEDLTRRLTAWMATNPRDGAQGEGRKQYVLVISNQSGSMFFDVRISAIVHRGSSAAEDLHLHKLPPGDYAVEYGRQADGSTGWGWARSLEELGDQPLRPLMQSPHYRVTAMRFTDSPGETWEVDDHGMLRSGVS